MYTITDEMEEEVQSWIDKLPDSLVKSQVVNLFDNVFPTNRMTAEQLEKFLSLQNALPKEFQPYPQTFAQILKNPSEDTEDVLAESHEHIEAQDESGDEGEQSQEALHTLGQMDKKKAGTKAQALKAKRADKKAAKSKATEDSEILGRNKTAPTALKAKPTVVIVNRKGK